MGPVGPQGPQGATGSQGPQGPAGVTVGGYASGPAPNNVGPSVVFLAPTVNVTITAGQSIFVTSQRALGGNGFAAANLGLWICHRNGGGPVVQSGFGSIGLRVPANTRVNFPMSAILTGLPAGTYAVGLCGSSSDWGSWTGADPNGTTSATVF
jgi:hypothetical protein